MAGLKELTNRVTAEYLDERFSGRYVRDAEGKAYRVQRVWAERRTKDFEFTFCLVPDEDLLESSFVQTEPFASCIFVDPAGTGVWHVDIEAEACKQELVYAYCWKRLEGLGRRAKTEEHLRLLRAYLRELNRALEKLKALVYIQQGVDHGALVPFLNRECLPSIQGEMTGVRAVLRGGGIALELRGQDTEGEERILELECREFVTVWERAVFAPDHDRAGAAREACLRLSRRHRLAIGRVLRPLLKRKQRFVRDDLDRYSRDCLAIGCREMQRGYDLDLSERLRPLVRRTALFWVEEGVVWMLDREAYEVSAVCFSPFHMLDETETFFPNADVGAFTVLVEEYRAFLSEWFDALVSGVGAPRLSFEEIVAEKVPEWIPDSFSEDVEQLQRAEEDLWNLAFSTAQKVTVLREDLLQTEAELFYGWEDPNAFPHPRPAEQISQDQRQAFWRMWHFRVLLGSFWVGDLRKRQTMVRGLAERLGLKRRMQQQGMSVWVLGLYCRERFPRVERAEAPAQQRTPEKEFVRKRVRRRPFARYLLLAAVALVLAYLLSDLELLDGLLDRFRQARERVSSGPVERQPQQGVAEEGEGLVPTQTDSGRRAGTDVSQGLQPRSGEREQLGRRASSTGRDEMDRDREVSRPTQSESGEGTDTERIRRMRRRRPWLLVLLNVLFVATAGMFGWLLVDPARMRDKRRRHMLDQYLRHHVRNRPEVYRVEEGGVRFDWDALKRFEPADAAHIHKYRAALTIYREKFRTVFADFAADGLWRHRLEALFVREVYLAMERDYLENARVPISHDLLPLFPPLRVNAKHRVFLRKGFVETTYDPEEMRRFFDAMLRAAPETSPLGFEEKIRSVEREERTFVDVLFGDKRWFTVLYVAGALTLLYLGLFLVSAPGQEITLWRGIARFFWGAVCVFLFLVTPALAGLRIYRRWFGFPRAHRDAWRKIRFRLRGFPLDRFSHWVELTPARWINLRTRIHRIRDVLAPDRAPDDFLHISCELADSLEVRFRIHRGFARYIPDVQELVQRHLRAYLQDKRARRTGHKTIVVDTMATSLHFSEIYHPKGGVSYIFVRDAFEVLRDHPSLMRALVIGHILFQTVQLLEIEPVAYEFPEPLQHFKNILEATGADRTFFDAHFRLGTRGRYGLCSYGQWGHFRPIMRMVAADRDINWHEARERPYTLSELNEHLDGLGMFSVAGHFTSNTFFADRYDRFMYKDVKRPIVFVEEELGEEPLRVRSVDIREQVCARSMLVGGDGKLYVVPPAEKIRVDSSLEIETGIDFRDGNGEPLSIEPPLAFPVMHVERKRRKGGG